MKELLRKGYDPVIVDDLSEGHAPAVPEERLHRFSLADAEALRTFLSRENVDAVIHFAAHCYVGESMDDPLKYYRNNTANALNLLEEAVRAGVRRFVFSSTCATYGDPQRLPLREDHPQNPVNVYGDTKLVVEKMLRSLDRSHDFRSVSLRYFNAAGADPEGELGEDHHPETHLIPLVLQVALGKREWIRIFADDSDTPDVSCIRAYLLVSLQAPPHTAPPKFVATNQSVVGAAKRLCSSSSENGGVATMNFPREKGKSSVGSSTRRQNTSHVSSPEKSARRAGPVAKNTRAPSGTSAATSASEQAITQRSP